jgi:hypothetical protein
MVASQSHEIADVFPVEVPCAFFIRHS